MSTTHLISAPYSWGQFTPVFILVGLALVLLLADVIFPRISKKIYPLLGAVGVLLVSCGMTFAEGSHSYGILACLATVVCLLMAYDYRSVVYASVGGGAQEDGAAEFTVLPILACAGIVALTQARDLVMLFVSLEIITLCSYAMAGYFRRNQGSIEAGVKYLILGAVSTGFLVMGAAWFFGTTGSFILSPRFEMAALSNPYLCTGFLLALAFIFMGVFFKIGAAPMHTWIPDVYQGAPTPISAFLAVASKVGGFVALVLVFLPLVQVHAVSGGMLRPVMQTLTVVAAATLLIGNLAAIPQQNMKRLLGYSSIGHAGFILVLATGLRSSMTPDIFFYLVAYAIATLALFYAVSQLRISRGHEEISVFRGLGRTHPRTSFLISVCLASLAGVPLTAGFLAKLLSFRSVVITMNGGGDRLSLWLLVVMVICAAAGFYYYFKVLRAMYWETPDENESPVSFSPICTGVLTAAALVIILLGTVPLVINIFPVLF